MTTESRERHPARSEQHRQKNSAFSLPGLFESRLQLVDSKAFLLLRIGFRGDRSDASRRHAERVEESTHGAWAALESGQLLDFCCRLVERRGRMFAEIGLKLIAMALQFACRCVEVQFCQFLDPAGLEQSAIAALSCLSADPLSSGMPGPRSAIRITNTRNGRRHESNPSTTFVVSRFRACVFHFVQAGRLEMS